ncbi:uncharacterized protein LOC124287471 [Haliotis rubra]|uniref:uncharacterized protein LOC124287471 n=1 Tax=Haliotis rubra TaxID=36100 RepID=UPI001EE56F48|nr:uncharacterized protein LOC124287471 [Haliotis rubra]
MPRKVRKKIGRKPKREKNKKLIASWATHNEYNYCLHQSFDPESRDYQGHQDWSTAMLRFFDTHSQSQDEQESELTDSDGATANEFYVILDRPYLYHPDEDVDRFVTRLSQVSVPNKSLRL